MSTKRAVKGFAVGASILGGGIFATYQVANEIAKGINSEVCAVARETPPPGCSDTVVAIGSESASDNKIMIYTTLGTFAFIAAYVISKQSLYELYRPDNYSPGTASTHTAVHHEVSTAQMLESGSVEARDLGRPVLELVRAMGESPEQEVEITDRGVSLATLTTVTEDDAPI